MTHFYADDVQLKPKSTAECQVALDICSRYAVAYNMTWSIPKCAIVGRCSELLTLSGSVLQHSDSYKYLGAEHRATGVDWRRSYTLATAKHSRLLTALSDRNWHPRLRLIVYKTFIRPINEYTAVLSWIWAQKELSSRVDIIKQMELSHQNALKWVFNRRRYLKLMDYMSGLGPWTHRMDSLKAGLVFSLKRMKTTNPLHAARAKYMVSTSRHFILPNCFKSDYSRAYLQAKNQNKKLAWKTWKNHQLEFLRKAASSKSATISYYFPVLNRDRSSPIFLLKWPLFDLAMNWRSNNTLLQRTCCCSKPFNRSHLSCVLAGNLLFDSIVTSGPFKSATQKVASTSGSSHQLTVLDYLLNQQKIADFQELFKTLQKALESA
jgi:hypothetical protein